MIGQKKTMATKDDVLALTKELMAHPSTGDNLAERIACLELVKQRFGEHLHVTEMSFKEDRPLLVLSTSRVLNGGIIIATHVDVVDADAALFTPVENGDKLIGRGAYDMKGATAAVLYAVRDYFWQDGSLPVTVFVTTDEEADGLSVQWLLTERDHRAKFAILPDGGSDTSLVVRQKGFHQIKLTVQGKTTHASTPWNGANPIERGMRFAEALKKKFPNPKDRKEWRTSVALTKCEAGKNLNQVPGSATFYFDIRFAREDDVHAVAALAEKVLKKDYSLERVAGNGIFSVNPDNHYIQMLAQAMRKNGKPITFENECATSDAIFFAEAGIPATLFRPQGGGAHEPGEWVSQTSLYQTYKNLVEFLATC